MKICFIQYEPMFREKTKIQTNVRDFRHVAKIYTDWFARASVTAVVCSARSGVCHGRPRYISFIEFVQCNSTSVVSYEKEIAKFILSAKKVIFKGTEIRDA